MTNEERYVRAFSALQPPEGWMDQLEAAKPGKRKRRERGLAAVLAAVMALTALFGAAYAADLGGIQSRFRGWYLGKEMDVAVRTEWVEDLGGDYGNPRCDYVFYAENGVELARLPAEAAHAMTPEELQDMLLDNVHLDTRNCVLSEDGRQVLEWVNGDHSIYIYYLGRTIDIGDCFDENGFGHYEGEVWFGKYGQWVEVWRTEEEPGWHFSLRKLDEKP